MRLVDDFELASVESVAQGGLHVEIFEALPGEFWGIDFAAIASAGFDVVHGKVGVFEERINIAAIGEDAYADAGSDDDVVGPDANGLSNGGEELLADFVGIGDGAKIREQDDELVAAHSGDGVGFAYAGLETA